MDYESNEFLTDGSVSFNYDDLSYHDKIKIKALQGLDNLAANLNAIANIKAIEFQLSHLNEANAGFTEQLNAKDGEIAALTSQLQEVQLNFQQQLSDMSEATQVQLADLADVNQAQLAAMNAQYEDSINEITASSQAQIDQANAAIEAAKTANNQSLTQAQASQALLEAEIASLKAANESLTENFNKFKSVLTSIDHLTDEVID